jgi:hypothetical protein
MHVHCICKPVSWMLCEVQELLINLGLLEVF